MYGVWCLGRFALGFVSNQGRSAPNTIHHTLNTNINFFSFQFMCQESQPHFGFEGRAAVFQIEFPAMPGATQLRLLRVEYKRLVGIAQLCRYEYAFTNRRARMRAIIEQQADVAVLPDSAHRLAADFPDQKYVFLYF